MQRLLFVALSMRIGGIERSLVNLLNILDPAKYSIDLLLFYPGGEYINQIPKHVTILKSPYLLRCAGMSMSEAKRSKNIFNILTRGVLAVLCKIMGAPLLFKLLTISFTLKGNYDAAISYSNNGDLKQLNFGCNLVVLEKSKASTKVAVIHNDYILAGIHCEYNDREYEKFNAIVNVSYAGKKVFDGVMPHLKDRSFVIYNPNLIENIRKMADEKFEDIKNNNDIRFVSVSRIAHAKGYDRALKAAKRLKEDGFRFSWVIVGDGPLYSELKEHNRELNLEDTVFFIGAKQNPFPYIKSADLFVVTSRFEGMPMTVAESLIVGTPVVTTEYGSVHEQVCHNVNGFIVGNDDDSVYYILKELLQNPNKIVELKTNIKEKLLTNDLTLNQFKEVVGG